MKMRLFYFMAFWLPDVPSAMNISLLKLRALQTIVTTLSLFIVAEETVSAQSNEFVLFAGSYSSREDTAIHVFRFNAETGALSKTGGVNGIANPSFLALAPDRKVLFSISGDREDSVASFRIDALSGTLAPASTQTLMGATGGCHLAVDPSGKWLITAAYSTGTVIVHPVGEGGILQKANETIQHKGNSVNTARQEASHLHSITFLPGKNAFLAADLGTDKLYHYAMNSTTGALKRGNPFEITLPPGSGPRHLAVGSDGLHVYVLNELTSSVSVFIRKKDVFELLQTIKTLPEAYNGPFWSSDIHLSPDGKHLYASNRAHDSITGFARDAKNGRLSLIGITPVEGKTPRNFTIDPTGGWVLAANQDSNDITVFRRDTLTGKLLFTGQRVAVSKPVCLLFVSN
jgi:6-phosphogluconolactonase